MTIKVTTTRGQKGADGAMVWSKSVTTPVKADPPSLKPATPAEQHAGIAKQNAILAAQRSRGDG